MSDSQVVMAAAKQLVGPLALVAWFSWLVVLPPFLRGSPHADYGLRSPAAGLAMSVILVLLQSVTTLALALLVAGLATPLVTLQLWSSWRMMPIVAYSFAMLSSLMGRIVTPATMDTMLAVGLYLPTSWVGSGFFQLLSSRDSSGGYFLAAAAAFTGLAGWYFVWLVRHFSIREYIARTGDPLEAINEAGFVRIPQLEALDPLAVLKDNASLASRRPTTPSELDDLLYAELTGQRNDRSQRRSGTTSSRLAAVFLTPILSRREWAIFDGIIGARNFAFGFIGFCIAIAYLMKNLLSSKAVVSTSDLYMAQTFGMIFSSLTWPSMASSAVSGSLSYFRWGLVPLAINDIRRVVLKVQLVSAALWFAFCLALSLLFGIGNFWDRLLFTASWTHVYYFAPSVLMLLDWEQSCRSTTIQANVQRMTAMVVLVVWYAASAITLFMGNTLTAVASAICIPLVSLLAWKYLIETFEASTSDMAGPNRLRPGQG